MRQAIDLGFGVAHALAEGPETGPALTFSNSLGTDFRSWDKMLPHLPDGLRIIRYDTRGHGLSDRGPEPPTIAEAANDLGRILDALGVRSTVVVGLSVGGLIAQQLAASRPDLTRALALCCTGAKIGSDEAWNPRLEAARAGGVEALADGVMERWFSESFRANRKAELALARLMLTRTSTKGYCELGMAIRDADLREQTKSLRLPTLCVAGGHDGATPPEVVEQLAALIPGARYELIENAGHMPPIEAPETLGRLISGFLKEIGWV